jgi:hypothetical protein
MNQRVLIPRASCVSEKSGVCAGSADRGRARSDKSVLACHPSQSKIRHEVNYAEPIDYRCIAAV